MDTDLSGRTVLVTGSARGLGRAIALACADAGGDVAINYRTSDAEAEATVAEAREHGARAASFRADVTKEGHVEALFDDVTDELGTVDTLVNNVGNFAPKHWQDIEPATWRNVVETNLTATYLTCRRAVPDMREAGSGRIVNIGYSSSEKGLVDPENFPYFAAKAGVIMFTRMLAADTQYDGITANAVSPYVIENSDVFPDDLPRGRAASFDEVVRPTLFFLDPENEYISGENLEVDGGWLPESV